MAKVFPDENALPIVSETADDHPLLFYRAAEDGPPIDPEDPESEPQWVAGNWLVEKRLLSSSGRAKSFVAKAADYGTPAQKAALQAYHAAVTDSALAELTEDLP